MWASRRNLIILVNQASLTGDTVLPLWVIPQNCSRRFSRIDSAIAGVLAYVGGGVDRLKSTCRDFKQPAEPFAFPVNLRRWWAGVLWWESSFLALLVRHGLCHNFPQCWVRDWLIGAAAPRSMIASAEESLDWVCRAWRGSTILTGLRENRIPEVPIRRCTQRIDLLQRVPGIRVCIASQNTRVYWTELTMRRSIL